MSRVVACTDADLCWPFGGKPHYKLDGRSYEYVDPFPCYAHDLALVKRLVTKVDKAVGGRIKFKPTYYVFHHESETRTNGWAMTHSDYERTKEGKPAWKGMVVLSGKRIPPHPAMTRYLVGHEYGHHAENELLRRLGKESHDGTIRKEYAKLRKCEDIPYYGGRTWHLSAQELLANDFRILVAELEPEFWPHKQIHPSKSKEVQKWWEETL